MNRKHLGRLAAAVSTTAAFLAACASQPLPAEPAQAALSVALPAPLDPETSAARAVEVSPRVLAAAKRLEGRTRRVEAMALPPDPAIAIRLGVPLDGLGGSPVSISIVEGIAWLFAADALQEEAARERVLAARELIAATVEAASEARGLVRALASAQDAEDSAEVAASAREELAAREEAALALGESTPAEARTRRREALEGRERAERAATRAANIRAELASRLASTDAPTAARTEANAITIAPLDETASTESLDVLRARVRVARAESELASNDGLGADARVGASVERDLEDRESVSATLEFALPVFRRTKESEARRAELAAERAELAEALRTASLANARAHREALAAKRAAELALAAASAAGEARDALAARVALGEAPATALLEARADAADANTNAAERAIELALAIAQLESLAATHPLRETLP